MDTLLILTGINEAADGRYMGRSNTHGAADQGPGGMINRYDWRVWSGSGYGKRLQAALGGGNGYAFEVTDMGQYVSVRATYHNSATGKTVSKTFIIVFDDPKFGDGRIFATSTKWRTISSLDQAASYIRSTIQSMS